MTITKNDLDRILKNLDDDARQSFLSMSREDQLLIILSMEGSNSNRLAIVERWQIEFQKDRNSYRVKRELKEEKEKENGNNRLDINPDDETDITEKIARLVAKKVSEANSVVWVWFRDRILPPIVIVFITGLLYLVFGGKLP